MKFRNILLPLYSLYSVNQLNNCILPLYKLLGKQYWAKSFPKYDILVNFIIKGYKAGVEKFYYNTQQWGNERTAIPWYKEEYEIGDVILYEWDKSNLDNISTIMKW